MSGFGGYGSVEFKIALLGGFTGLLIGATHGGLRGALIGAFIGAVGLFAAILLIIFICSEIGTAIVKIKGMKK